MHALRVQRDLSLRALASRLSDVGVETAPGTLSDIENGRREMRAPEIVALANVLGTSTGDLLGLDDIDLSAARSEVAALRVSLKQAAAQLWDTGRDARLGINKVAADIANLANSLPVEAPTGVSLGTAVDDALTLQHEQADRGTDEQGDL